MLSLEVSPYIIRYVFGQHAWKFKPTRTAKNVQNFELFEEKKTGFLKTIFVKALLPFFKTLLSLKQLFDGKLLLFRLLSFSVPKVMVTDTCNQVKNCTKHGRPV